MAHVTVMGAGIFGLSCAWACLQKGARVRVIDPGGPGAGASGGILGALAPHVPENWNEKKAFQFDSLIMSGPFWAEIARVSGISPGYARLGRLQPVADAAALERAHARARTAETLWQGRAAWRVVAAGDQPFMPVSATGWLVHDTLSARLHPRRACAALAAAIVARGGEVLRAGDARGLVLWATGLAGLDALSAHHGRTIGTGVKGQAALLHFRAPDRPQLFTDGLHIVPHADGTVAVGATSEHTRENPTDTDAQLDALIDRAVRAVPLLHGARVVERWAGLRPRARSRAPVLGAHPLHAGQFIANGGFKIGFGMAPKVGRVMADLMLDGTDAIPEGFRPGASF